MPARSLILVSVAAFLAVSALLYALDARERRAIANRTALIAQRRQELGALRRYDAEVERYRSAKDELQKRIDIINQLKQEQGRFDRELRLVAEVAALPHVTIDGITIGEEIELTLRADAGAAKAVEGMRIDGLRPIFVKRSDTAWTLRLETP